MRVVVEQTSASSLAVPLSGVVAMGWLLTSLSFFTCLLWILAVAGEFFVAAHWLSCSTVCDILVP